jgi:ribosome biogenesis GTPase A
MAKTKRIVIEKVRLVDIVYELLDARIPFSSQNPVISEIIGNKPKIIIFNKADLADLNELDKWATYFEKQGHKTLRINALTGKNISSIIPASKEVLADLFAKEKSRGRKQRPIRAMILGIPNVGKSTLINRLASKKALVTGDKPGVTKHAQYIRVGQDLELLDTPGILWPKFQDEGVAYKLALTGAIKDNILPVDEIVIYGFKFLNKFYKSKFEERYEIKVDIDNIIAIFDDIGKRRGCLLPGNNVNYERVSELFLYDFRHQKFGDIIMDRVKDV